LVGGKVCPGLLNASFTDDVPLSTTRHDLLSRAKNCPEAAPLANEVVTAGYNLVNAAHRLKGDMPLPPQFGEMLGAANRVEARRQKVVDHVVGKCAEEVREVSRIAAVEVAPDDGDVGVLDRL
jgi:hypothetical protein